METITQSLNKKDILALLEDEQLHININVIKVDMLKTPIMWSMQMLVEQAGFSKQYILEDIRHGVLIRDKHYVMKGTHYLFIRDEIVPYITNKFKIHK